MLQKRNHTKKNITYLEITLPLIYLHLRICRLQGILHYLLLLVHLCRFLSPFAHTTSQNFYFSPYTYLSHFTLGNRLFSPLGMSGLDMDDVADTNPCSHLSGTPHEPNAGDISDIREMLNIA